LVVGVGRQDRAVFVLVGGWPGSGKSTLAIALADELGIALLVKDEVKESLADTLGRPTTVAESQRLGRAAVMALLTVARRSPAAVIDSTWFDYTKPLVSALPGRVIEIRCQVPVELARERYLARSGDRHPGHLDQLRSEEELWSRPVEPLGLGPVVDVDTSGAVEIQSLAARVLTL
jgi:predicted kinase